MNSFKTAAEQAAPQGFVAVRIPAPPALV